MTENQRPIRAGHSTGGMRVGIAGWSYTDWWGLVYPPRKTAGFHEAAYLAEYFDVIEINTSFYHPLRASTCEPWLSHVAANSRFLFTAKLWQRFTHECGPSAPPSVEDERAVREGFDLLQTAGKLGAVLLQFPFSFHCIPENTAYLRSLLERFSDYPLVVEVRHASWNVESFYELLRERAVGFCNVDQPLIGRSMKPSHLATAAMGYVRLHGRRYDTWFSDDPDLPREERYNYLYSDQELELWADRVRKLAKHTGTTFVIANNHFQGKSVVNALQLINLLTGSKVRVPEPLRRRYPQLERIASEPMVEPTLFPEPPGS